MQRSPMFKSCILSRAGYLRMAELSQVRRAVVSGTFLGMQGFRVITTCEDRLSLKSLTLLHSAVSRSNAVHGQTPWLVTLGGASPTCTGLAQLPDCRSPGQRYLNRQLQIHLNPITNRSTIIRSHPYKKVQQQVVSSPRGGLARFVVYPNFTQGDQNSRPARTGALAAFNHSNPSEHSLVAGAYILPSSR